MVSVLFNSPLFPPLLLLHEKFLLCTRNFCEDQARKARIPYLTVGMDMDAKRRQLVLELGAAMVELFAILDASPANDDNDVWEMVLEMNSVAHEMIEAYEKSLVQSVGRGHCILGRRLPQLAKPKNDCYKVAVNIPERFVELVRFTPEEFEELHTKVYDVLALTRDIKFTLTEDENKLRRKRRYKYTSRERLFHFLMLLKSYPKFTSGSEQTALAKSALYTDFVWLRRKLSQHPVLVEEVQWGTPDELEEERRCLVSAGLLQPPFDNCVFMCDGTKDLGRRTAHYNRTNEPDYSQKGNGKSHLLFTSLLGRPMLLEGGIQGNENDSGAYRLTAVYNDPERYLLPHHTGLFDGVFQSPLHKNTDKMGVLPSPAPHIRKAPPVQRKHLRKANRYQRYLRCPIEQTFGHIKAWDIVGEGVFRGSLDQQGENFLICTQLSARMMRIRRKYPRGDRWLTGMQEDWEREWDMNGWLHADPLHPSLYHED